MAMLPCGVCGQPTELRCSDCMIDKGTPVAVCRLPTCRDQHEKYLCTRVVWKSIE